jgi:hypothetical protein
MPRKRRCTFLGTDAAKVDKHVNDWPAESKVHVRRTSTAFKRLIHPVLVFVVPTEIYRRRGGQPFVL